MTLTARCPYYCGAEIDGLLDYEGHLREHEARSIKTFITNHKITMEIVGGTSSNTLRTKKTVKDAEGWEHYAWEVHLFRGDTPPVEGLGPVSYRTGTGHSTRKWQEYTSSWIVTPTAPEIESVLDSLKLDASSYDDARDFEDFAANFGYDTDSRKAEALYRECGDQAKKLRNFLGRAAYDQLLYEVESL